MFAWLRRGATDAEVAVASAILSSSEDRRAEVLLEQFRRSPRVERRVDGSTMRVTVPWTTGDLMVDLDEDVVSDPAQVREQRSEQALWFRVHLARGGFFRCLEGGTDGRWPRRWEVDADELVSAASGALKLPDDVSSDALAEWLGRALPDGPGLTVRRPATTGAIVALGRREELPVPGEVREFLEVTDGMLVGDWAVLGVRDLHVVEVEGGSYWQVAVGTGSGDVRRCLVDPAGGLVIVPSHDARAGDLEPVGLGFRDWLVGLLVGSVDGP